MMIKWVHTPTDTVFATAKSIIFDILFEKSFVNDRKKSHVKEDSNKIHKIVSILGIHWGKSTAVTFDRRLVFVSYNATLNLYASLILIE